jgi:hypothetical protein
MQISTTSNIIVGGGVCPAGAVVVVSKKTMRDVMIKLELLDVPPSIVLIHYDRASE